MRTATCARAWCARNSAREISVADVADVADDVDIAGEAGEAGGSARETTLKRGRWLWRHPKPLIAPKVFSGVSGADWLPVESLTIDRPPDVHRLLV